MSLLFMDDVNVISVAERSKFVKLNQDDHHMNPLLTLFLLMMTQEPFVDSLDQDQTAHSVQSDL